MTNIDGRLHQVGDSQIVAADTQPYFKALVQVAAELDRRNKGGRLAIIMEHHGPDGRELTPVVIQ